ncbi:MAG: deaminase [Candidatus Woesebacteria bacterium]
MSIKQRVFTSDSKFLKIAEDESKKSTCLSKKVGAVICLNEEILSSGHNDTFSDLKCGEGGCVRCKQRFLGILASGEKRRECKCLHAEFIAIRNASTHDIDLTGASMYVSIPPCKECAIAIHQARMKRVISKKPSHIGKGIEILKRMNIDVLLI